MMNFSYDEKQVTAVNRRINNVHACRVTRVSKEFGIECAFRKNTFQIRPSDFEVRQYQPGEYVDFILKTMNGQVCSAQRLGMTPEVFIPQ